MRTAAHFNVSHNKPDSKQPQSNHQVVLTDTLRVCALTGVRLVQEEVLVNI